MSQQLDNNQQPFNPMKLLMSEEWLRKVVESEDKVKGNIGAGLDWGDAFGKLMLNPELLGRLTALRISLNREIRLLLSDWNLGSATDSAVKTARSLLLEKLKSPTLLVQEKISAVLHTDELFGEEFISNHDVLQELISTMLEQEDWKTISRTAGDFLSAEIMSKATSQKILL
ncbi:MAG: hypothetical protein KME64_03315 [Scytonematopsis contorta HA4267-MV1]|jgi:hypothetical protein|nr:hypothetical protein [Scytonematopsis contorta HA4267-MV1]